MTKSEVIRWGVVFVLIFALSFVIAGCGTDCSYTGGMTCYHIR